MSDDNKYGRYHLLEKLNAGGMAEVFLSKAVAADGLGKFFAVKRILPQYSDHPEFIEMFKEEARVAVHLKHKNIVSIIDFGFEKKQFFLVMDFVEGKNLREVINTLTKQSKGFTIPQALHIIKEAAAGLDYAHRAIDPATGNKLNVIHRDISPQNIMLNYEGEIKIVDFGIAKAETETRTKTERTTTGMLKGKFGYMSPEQTMGLDIDQRTDVFSLGIVLWELLARERLFHAKNEAHSIKKIQDCIIPSLRKINAQVHPELEKIVNKALAKDKNTRYDSAATLYKDLNVFLNTYFPAFSPTELSEFLKNTFSSDILNFQQKMKDYAKAPLSESDKTIVTVTDHDYSETGLLNIDPQEKPIHLEGIKKHKVLPGKLNTETSSKSLKDIYLSGLKSEASRPQIHTVDNTNFFTAIGAILILAFTVFIGYRGGYFDAFLSKKTVYSQDAASTQPTRTTVETPAVASESVIHIQSNPQGARVYINNQDVGAVTPWRTKLPVGSEYLLTLKSNGYEDYSKKHTSKEGSIIASLRPIKPAFVDLKAVNAGASSVVYINDTPISNKLPLYAYPIPSGQKVTIKVVNQVTSLYGVWEGRLGPGQRKTATIVLDRRIK